MGGAQSSEVAENNLKVINSTLQATNTVCAFDSTGQVNGNTIVIAGSTINGGLNVVAQGNLTGTCVQNNTLGAQVSNALQASASQNNTSVQPFMTFAAGNKNDQSIVNNESATNFVTQLVNSTCQFTQNISVDDNVVVVQGSTVSGGVNLSANATETGNCNLVNSSRIQLTNQLTATASQTNKTLTTGSLIIVAIILAIILGVLVPLLGGKKNKGTGTTTAVTPTVTATSSASK